MLTEKETALLARRLKPRGRPPIYDIDGLREWEVYEIPAHIQDGKLLSAVNAIQRAGKRRGWEIVRVGTHRVVRKGTGPIPSSGDTF